MKYLALLAIPSCLLIAGTALADCHGAKAEKYKIVNKHYLKPTGTKIHVPQNLDLNLWQKKCVVTNYKDSRSGNKTKSERQKGGTLYVFCNIEKVTTGPFKGKGYYKIIGKTQPTKHRDACLCINKKGGSLGVINKQLKCISGSSPKSHM